MNKEDEKKLKEYEEKEKLQKNTAKIWLGFAAVVAVVAVVWIVVSMF